MSTSPNHYGFCCAGSQCIQRNCHVTLLMICSICGNAMHQSCGNTSGDSSLICFSCLGIDCARSPEEVAYLKIANDLAEEFCIEESSDGVNFRTALFPSTDDFQLKSSSVAGISGDLEASFSSNHDVSCAMQHPDQVIHSKDEAPPTLNSSNFGGTEGLHLSEFSVGAVPDASVHGRSGNSVRGRSISGRGRSNRMFRCSSDAGKSSRGRGRRSAATGQSTGRSTGRSSRSRGRGHRMGSQNRPTAFGETVQQSAVHDSVVNHDFNPFSRMPNLPAALRHQLNWISVNAAECSAFSFQKTANQHILKDHCKHFIDNFRRRCSHKLRLHSLEASEVNLFSLLIGSAFDSMLEYTNESMSIHKLQLIAPSEFCLFLGTMLLSSSFNASIDTMWEMMRTLSKDKCMTRERYNQILNNLRGFDMSRRMILHYTGSWDDQRNKLKNLHLLGKKISNVP
jgi:hypothetical protein